nr:MAG TPA: minor tail protein [Caudoviricetes sp.]
MSLNLGTLHAAVDLDTQAYNDGMNSLPGTAESAMRKVAAYSATYLSGRALFSFGKDASMEFSKMEEGANKLKYVYTEISASAKLAAKDLEDTFGLANQTATNMIANIGDLLTGFGFQQAKSLEMARQVAERGIDVASFKGLNQEQVVANMTAALTGNTETLKSMGVVINQNSKEFTGMVKQIQDTTGATEQQAKAQAILNEIMRQTKNAAGDYLRPEAPRTYAQVLGDLNEQIKRFKAQTGGDIVPITQPLLDGARGLLKAYNDLEPANRRLVQGLALMGVTIAAMQSPIAKNINAKLIEAKLSLQNIKLYDYEAAAKEASENRKLAAINKRIAAQDALMAKEKLKAAKEAEEQASLVRIGARSIVASKNGSATREDIERLRKAEADYAQAVKNTQAAEVGRARATAHAAAMRRQLNTVTRAGVVAQHRLTVAQTLGGRAALALTAGIRGATASLRAFLAAMGPIGIAFLAWQGLSMVIGHFNGKLEESLRIAKENADKAKATLEQGDSTRKNDLDKLDRLAELSKAERLNNAEIREAQALNEQLANSYEITIGAIDKATGKYLLQAGAIDQVRQKMKEQAELQAKENYNAAERRLQNAFSKVKNSVTWDRFMSGQIGKEGRMQLDKMDPKLLERLLPNIKNNWLRENIREILDAYSARRTAGQRLIEARGGNLSGESEADRNARNRTVSEETRRQLDDLENRKWTITYESANSEAKLSMLNRKLKELQDKQFESAGNKPLERYSAEELQREKEILETLKQRRQLERDIIEEKKRQKWGIEDEESAFQRSEQAKADRQFQTLADNSINELKEKGDYNAAAQTAQNLFDAANRAAEQLKQQYLAAWEKAKADGKITEEERREVEKAKQAMAEAEQKREHWEGKVREVDRERRQPRDNADRAVMTTTASLFKSMLGTDTIAQKQLEAAEKQVDKLDTIAENTRKNNEAETYA